MNKVIKTKKYEEKTFEDIKHFNECGNEYWTGRELQVALEYTQWRNFELVINKAKEACENSKNNISDHFADVSKMISLGKGAQKKVNDYHLSRYACYLIVQNGDPRKEVIALGQTYFAIQTRKQEIRESENAELSENEKRFYQRKLTKKKNRMLNEAAKNAGVKNFDQFHNA
ncbi:MAG: BRO family protein, partial [Bacilli bacterium]